MRVIRPVRGLGHRQVIDAADFEQIYEFAGFLDDPHRGIDIECWLEADPGINSGLVKRPKRGDPIAWQRRAGFPLVRKSVVQAGQR